MKNDKAERIYYLDAMRAVLMMLGVVYHSSQIFNAERKEAWLINSDHTAVLAPWLSEIVHLFRMPTFFMVSGYFAFMTIKKYSPNAFIRIRLLRIFIPLVTTALTLNIVERILVIEGGWSSFNFISYISSKVWIGHLWFLIDLIFFFLVVYVSAKFLRNILVPVIKKIEFFFLRIPMILLLLTLPIITVFLTVINHKLLRLEISVFGITDLYHLIYYFQFFCFGIVLYKNENILKRFSGFSPIVSTLIILLAFLFLNSEFREVSASLSSYIHMVSIWFSSALCFFIFKQFTYLPSKTFFFLSEASYSVYLFHELLVVAFGLLFIKLGFGGDSALIVLMAVVTLISLSLHKYVVLKLKPIRLLFNGRK